MCETGLIQERLRLHTYARDFVTNRASMSWRWFHSSGGSSLMPSLEGIYEGCTRGAQEIRELVDKPFGTGVCNTSSIFMPSTNFLYFSRPLTVGF